MNHIGIDDPTLPQAAPRIPRRPPLRRDLEPAAGVLLGVLAGLAAWLIFIASLVWP